MGTTCCNSCEDQSPSVPLTVANRPGLQAIAYRIGEYGDFLQSIRERLSLSEHLKRFTARDTSDYSIALMDAWSVLADVFTFYQERIANESYLRTATERFSILELARLVGYELRPGVAASTYIAFTLEQPQTTLDAKLPTVQSTNLYGGSLPVTIDKGVKIQSIPEKDQLPQVFETANAIEARIEWNEIRPRQHTPQEPVDDKVVYINGINNNIRKGDVLLLRNAAGNKLRTVHNVQAIEDRGITRLNLEAVVVKPTYTMMIAYIIPSLVSYMTPMSFTNTVSTQIMQSSFVAKDLKMIKQVNKWTDLEMKAGLNQQVQLPATTEVYVFRKKAAVFGYNAQKNTTIKDGKPLQSDYTLAEKNNMLQLDNSYDEVLSGSFVAIQNPANSSNSISFYRVKSSTTGVMTRYGISSKTTTVELEPADAGSSPTWWGGGTSLDNIRSAAVLTQSEQLSIAYLPDDSLVVGDEIVLDKYYPDLKEKQAIAVSGEKYDLPGILYSEICFIKEIIVEGGRTILLLQESLKYEYIRESVYINANVVLATNGETVQEMLGSGNAAIPFQQFILKQPPLTYTSASSASGIASSLEIRVNDILWKEVDFFLDHAANERIFITRRDNDGNTKVIFGDGVNGSRLPTGNNNVVASYRKGIGASGLLKAKQLSQLVTKPLQVKSAINPIITTGAEDPETLDAARRNASLTILTLDRIVSLRDYEDFAVAFAGVAKAHATWARRLNRQQVFLTVAGEDGASIDANSSLYQNLLKAIGQAGTNYAPLNMVSYTPRYFKVTAGLMIDPDFIADKVLEDAAARLAKQFSFASRNFMQSVTYSEVIACLQETKGVIAVDIDSLHRSEDGAASIQYMLEASLPQIASNNFTGAELLTLAPDGISLKVIQ